MRLRLSCVRVPHLRSEVGAFCEAEADLEVFAPGEAQERFLVRAHTPHGEALKLEAPFGTTLPARRHQRFEPGGRYQQRQPARRGRMRLDVRVRRLRLGDRAGERFEPQGDAVDRAEEVLSADHQGEEPGYSCDRRAAAGRPA